MRILLVDHHKTTQRALAELFVKEDFLVAADAAAAITAANDKTPDLVILELSLAGHSGLEFLYEFRTYPDWRDVPVIVYSTVRLESESLRSRAWEQLGIHAYLYKPQTSLAALVTHVAQSQPVPS